MHSCTSFGVLDTTIRVAPMSRPSKSHTDRPPFCLSGVSTLMSPRSRVSGGVIPPLDLILPSSPSKSVPLLGFRRRCSPPAAFCEESVCEGTDLPLLVGDGKRCDGDICTQAECCAVGKEGSRVCPYLCLREHHLGLLFSRDPVCYGRLKRREYLTWTTQDA